MITIDAAVKEYSDEDLLRNLRSLADEGRDVTADLIALLVALIGRRALWAGLGYPSPHAFCVDRLLLSDAQAYHRLAAADVARRFPLVLARLRDGRLTLTNVALLRPHLTEENGPGVLAWAEGRSRHEVESFIRTLAPLPDVTPSLRRLAGPPARLPQRAAERPWGMITGGDVGSGAPLQLSELVGQPRETCGREPRREILSDAPKPGEECCASTLFDLPTPNKNSCADGLLPASDTLAASALSTPAAPPSSPATHQATVAMLPTAIVRPTGALPYSSVLPPRPELRPLAPARYSLRLTISEETRDKLRRAADLLGNNVASGDYGEMLDRALTLLVQHLEKARFGVRWAKPRRTATRSETEPDITPPPPRRPRPSPQPADNRLSTTEGANEKVLRAKPDESRPRTRYIPAAVRRAVFARDGARCSFSGPAGRCTQTRGLQLHHRQPFAEGGPPTVENLQVLCTLHNQHEAVRWFGEEAMPTMTREPGAGIDGSGARRVLFDQSKSVRPPGESPLTPPSAVASAVGRESIT